MLATLTSKAQLTLPKDIRSLLGLEPGDRVAFTPLANGQVTVSKAGKPSVASLRGILPKPERALSIEEMDEAIVQVAAERYRSKTQAIR